MSTLAIVAKQSVTFAKVTVNMNLGGNLLATLRSYLLAPD
jgi:hypothetical protein